MKMNTKKKNETRGWNPEELDSLAKMIANAVIALHTPEESVKPKKSTKGKSKRRKKKTPE
jgi:hypothetical protein